MDQGAFVWTYVIVDRVSSVHRLHMECRIRMSYWRVNRRVVKLGLRLSLKLDTRTNLRAVRVC